MLKRLPRIRKIRVRFLGWEEPHRSKWQPTPVLLLENPMTEEPGRLLSMRSQKSRTRLSDFTFMDLTFQVAMQYCSLQHWALLPSPVTSTTGCCFCFGSLSSFFLELFLQWSPVAYLAPTDLGSSLLSALSFLLFHTLHGVLKARILKWFAIPFSSGPRFVKTLHHDLSVLGGPTWYGS